jgi:hypothetical protein
MVHKTIMFTAGHCHACNTDTLRCATISSNDCIVKLKVVVYLYARINNVNRSNSASFR